MTASEGPGIKVAQTPGSPAPLSSPVTQQPHLQGCGSARALLIAQTLPAPADMQQLLELLQDPELVARFQRRCGLHLLQEPNRGSRTANGEKPRGKLQGSWNNQDRNSNYTYNQNPSPAQVGF